MLASLSLLALAAVGALASPIADGPALGVTVGSPGLDATADDPDPTKVFIKDITYGGSGCPQNSVGKFISSDRHTFTLIFDSMVASIGTGVAVAENRKNCQINLDLQYPSGFQYSILNTVFRGYADLAKGVSGTQSATYYFSGDAKQVTATSTFKGPTTGDYSTPDTIPFSSVVWSPCGAALPININSQVRLTGGGGASGLLTQDSLDGKITYVVGIQWQKCKV
jgi:hypothetical protein